MDVIHESFSNASSPPLQNRYNTHQLAMFLTSMRKQTAAGLVWLTEEPTQTVNSVSMIFS